MRRHWVLPTLLSVALVAVGVWGFTQYNQRLQYRTYLENQYQKSFYELVDNVGNLEVKLSKMMVTATPSQNILLLTDIWRQSNAAQQNLGQLPISHQVLGKTSKFINQLGDFCYSLSKGAADGKTIGRKDMEQLQTL
jgi:spore germination protein